MPDRKTATAERVEAPESIAAPSEAPLVLTDRPAFDPSRAPVWDSLNERQKALLKAKSPNLTDYELAQAVELAAAYQLDPYAGEIWFAKGKDKVGQDGQTRKGKLLIMVGRDGLRKIVQRNGLDMDCDVVRANDTFVVERTVENGKRIRLITHKYEGNAKDRGDIVGAWAEVWDHRTGQQRGYFFAPLGEFKPERTGYDSPWTKTVSVMIMAAAERQAARQGTPLGGLLIEGENETIDSTAEEIKELPASVPEHMILPPAAGAVLARAERVGYTQLPNQDTVRMMLHGQSETAVKAWCDERHAEMDALEQEPSVAEAMDALEQGVVSDG